MLSPGCLLNGRYRIIQQLGKGGMAYVFDVCDESEDHESRKVLKLLYDDCPDLIERLKKEAEMLQRLPYSGIPHVGKEDGYFCESLPNFPDPLHYLVMDKVTGETLDTWLENPKNYLTEKEAIAWLKQLVEVLDHLHRQKFLHRDIKPSNIIRQPDGQLVLIDFGISREMTTSYHEKLQDGETGTRYGTRGYAPPEQMLDGRAGPPADFYALGRTLISLLTRKTFSQLPTGKHPHTPDWRSAAPQVSPEFADLLDRLTAYDEKHRPQTIQEILRAIALLEKQQERAYRWYELAWVALWSGLVTGLCLGLRAAGGLQMLELKAFDLFLQLRPPETPDARILLITYDEADETWQREQQMSGLEAGQNIADETLLQLLTVLQRHQARVIGLDIVRDQDRGRGASDPQMQQPLQPYFQGDRLVAVCSSPIDESEKRRLSRALPPNEEISQDMQHGVAAPRGAHLVGFTNSAVDPDGVVRRHFIFRDSPLNSPCTVPYAFGPMILLRYWNDDGLAPTYWPASPALPTTMRVGDRTWPFLILPFGGYQRIDDDGRQLPIHYRATRTPLDVTPHIPLRELLTASETQVQQWVQGKIVLIGVTGSNLRDQHQTSLGKLPGVAIHAHIISQFLSAVEDGRPLIWVWPLPVESAWILGWALGGGFLAWQLRNTHWIALANGLFILGLTGICWIALLHGGWLPWLPGAIALGLASFGYLAIKPLILHHLFLPISSRKTAHQISGASHLPQDKTP